MHSQNLLETNLSASSLQVNYTVDDEEDAYSFPSLKANQGKVICYFSH